MSINVRDLFLGVIIYSFLACELTVVKIMGYNPENKREHQTNY